MNSLWTEKYRPKDPADFECSSHLKNFLKHALENGFPHLLLYGPPGTGKTTFASLLHPTFQLNASDERGIDTIRNKIKNLACTVAKQVIVLDECENLTKDSQTCLRRILEDYPNTSFIFCTNYYNKIIPPLKSRLLKFKFSTSGNKTLESIGSKELLGYDSTFYSELFKKCGGDLRRSINILQGIKPLKSVNIDDVVGLIPKNTFDGFKCIDHSNYKEYIKQFIRDGFSVLQLIVQISSNLWGSDVQKCEFSRILSDGESKCFSGCSDEIVLTYLVMNKISIYN